jgi:predicted DNA-binding protein (UPF0278 family)
MKVTSIIPDEIVKEVKKYAGGKNLTESLIIALDEWISLKKIQQLNKEIEMKPFEFTKGFSAKKIRKINRN